MQETKSSVDEFGIDRHSSLKFKQRGGRKVVIPADGSSIEKQTNETAINTPLINSVAQFEVDKRETEKKNGKLVYIRNKERVL